LARRPFLANWFQPLAETSREQLHSKIPTYANPHDTPHAYVPGPPVIRPQDNLIHVSDVDIDIDMCEAIHDEPRAVQPQGAGPTVMLPHLRATSYESHIP
jgi:hypothetical protein